MFCVLGVYMYDMDPWSVQPGEGPGSLTVVPLWNGASQVGDSDVVALRSGSTPRHSGGDVLLYN